MQKYIYTPEIWTISDFLTEAECEQLIYFSELKGYEEATVSLPEGAKMLKGIRDNQRILYHDAQLAQTYWERLREFCPPLIDADWEALGLNEQFRFYKYEPSQRFKRHLDGRFRRNAQEESRITFLLYLNDDFEGGETRFDTVTIQPKTGTALCFVHEQKHEGCPLIAGTKYALRSDVMYRKI
jgi:2OG-Fe(II) oxygenase superfamily